MPFYPDWIRSALQPMVLGRTRWRLMMVLALPSLLIAQPPSVADRAEIQIERTYLPDAGPSAFAVGFPSGVNFCYDPIRGGLNYAWTGAFVDLTSVRPGAGKLVKPVELLGPVVYREQGAAPLRPGDAAHEPARQFLGYHVGKNSVEFRYAVDGRTVKEEITPLPNGQGLVRRFHVEASSSTAWWFLPGAAAKGKIAVKEGKPEADGWRVSPAAKGEFTIEVRFGGPQP